MKQFAFIIIMLTTILSCNNTKKESADAQRSKKVLPYDWSKPILLKEKMLTALKEKQEAADKIIVDYLNEYAKLENEINEILQNQPNLDTLNTLAYADKSKVSQDALALEKEVNTNGFKISFSEGMIYIIKDAEFIKSQTIDLLDSTSVDFINLYCDELDSSCCDDAAIMISEETLAKRAYQWGELSKKVERLRYEKIAKDEYKEYLQLLFMGIDNTPSFDLTTNRYNPKLLEQLQNVIKNHPNSLAAKEFTQFIDLLKNANYVKNESVESYLKSKFESQ